MKPQAVSFIKNTKKIPILGNGLSNAVPNLKLS